MSRFLFIVPPFTGHVNPTVSVAAALAARGHEVAWAGPAEHVAQRLPPGALLHDIPLGDAADYLREATDKARRVRGLEALKFLWEDVLLPLGHAAGREVAGVDLCGRLDDNALAFLKFEIVLWHVDLILPRVEYPCQHRVHGPGVPDCRSAR